MSPIFVALLMCGCLIAGLLLGAVFTQMGVKRADDILHSRILQLETELREAREQKEITVELPKQMELTPHAIKALGAAIADSFRSGRN